MPLYAKLTKDRNIFVGPSNGQDDSETESDMASPTNTPTVRILHLYKLFICAILTMKVPLLIKPDDYTVLI